MALDLYGHLLSSYTQKVLIALYESGTPFTFRAIGPDTPDHVTEWRRRWPLAKFPVLLDGERTIAESSIIIEYLDQSHPRANRLLPIAADAALEVRFLDRFFDLHVMAPMQAAVDGALSGDTVKQRDGLAKAVDRLTVSYQWLEAHLVGRTWAAGNTFSLADCAAAPALFYADWTYPMADTLPTLRAYRARLLARPSVKRCVDDARPFRHLFPLGAPDRD